MEQLCKDRESDLAQERQQLSDLRLRLEERSAELDSLRKKFNRDLPINGFDSAMSSSTSSTPKHELTTARDEITGLKCVLLPYKIQIV